MATEGKLMEIPEDIKALMFQTWLPALVNKLLAKIDKLPKEYLVEIDGHQRLDTSAIENMVIIMHYILK